MFPWPWIFVWAPHWPASGNVEFGDWTNSLLTIREIEIVSKLLKAGTAPGVHLANVYGRGTGQPVLSKAERAVAENLLERLKARR